MGIFRTVGPDGKRIEDRVSRLEKLTLNTAVRGILPDALATVVYIQWLGSEALELACKSPSSRVANERLYRHGKVQR